jgi:hypothetical protein
MPAFVTPGHDPTLSTWYRDVCPPDLKKYYCVHGHYTGHRNVFPCPICKDRPRQDLPRLAQRQSTGTTRRGQQGRHLRRGPSARSSAA